jgi:GDPmannose 4,6-dehydratase
VVAAFAEIGVRLRWEGEGAAEKGIVDTIEADSKTALRPGDTVVRIDPGYFRPTEVDYLLGDPTKAREVLGWTPTVSFDELVRTMVQEDLKEADRDRLCDIAGFPVTRHVE